MQGGAVLPDALLLAGRRLLLLLLLHGHALLCEPLSHSCHVRHVLLCAHVDAAALAAVQLPAHRGKQRRAVSRDVT